MCGGSADPEAPGDQLPASTVDTGLNQSGIVGVEPVEQSPRLITPRRLSKPSLDIGFSPGLHFLSRSDRISASASSSASVRDNPPSNSALPARSSNAACQSSSDHPTSPCRSMGASVRRCIDPADRSARAENSNGGAIATLATLASGGRAALASGGGCRDWTCPVANVANGARFPLLRWCGESGFGGESALPGLYEEDGAVSGR